VEPITTLPLATTGADFMISPVVKVHSSFGAAGRTVFDTPFRFWSPRKMGHESVGWATVSKRRKRDKLLVLSISYSIYLFLLTINDCRFLIADLQF
jgi:hypothetical protein